MLSQTKKWREGPECVLKRRMAWTASLKTRPSVRRRMARLDGTIRFHRWAFRRWSSQPRRGAVVCRAGGAEGVWRAPGPDFACALEGCCGVCCIEALAGGTRWRAQWGAGADAVAVSVGGDNRCLAPPHL